jgi:mannan endo-1,4-beta-mannosidase
MRPASYAAGSGVASLPWIGVQGSYFADEAGRPFLPIGHNDSVSWANLAGLYRRREVATADAHFAMLARSGVTVVRLMLEYAQVRHRYFEKPAGRFVPAMVQLWDDVVALAERHGVRLLLTPFDTFFTWNHWRHHPYNSANGGPLAHPSRLLTDPAARAAIKARLAFAVERWGGSGAVFAWDLWNEIHPAQSEDCADGFPEFIHDLASFVRALETRLFGRSHPLTVSLFGPELRWRGHMPLTDPIFRHPDLDMASIHVYEEGTIDDPRDTVAPALGMARIVGEALGEIRDGRPFFDSEHGPIHRFKDKRRPLPPTFDDEYFRHMQWAHLAAGGAGGGMRWPNRTPHVLSEGMHRAQAALAAFVPMIDWVRFARRSLHGSLAIRGPAAGTGCGDADQAILWLVRTDTLRRDGTLHPSAEATPVEVTIPGLAPGVFHVTAVDTCSGRALSARSETATDGGLRLSIPLATDLVLAIRREA